jgi:uncharacterized phage protein (TIGR01671 family)
VYGSFIPDALEGGNSDLVSWGFIRRYNRDIGKMETIEVDRETIGQFTGLHDKNGKEIYEGDIVAFEDSDGGYEYQDIVINTGIVEYGELGFYFTNRVAVEMEDFYIKDGRCDEIEVIGNIHDNPELIGRRAE